MENSVFFTSKNKSKNLTSAFKSHLYFIEIFIHGLNFHAKRIKLYVLNIT